VVLLLLREFARSPLTFLNAFSNFFLIMYVIMSENEWIEKQKQRLSQNCIVQGQSDCWLCSLEGIDSILPWQSDFLGILIKKTLYIHRYSYMIFNRVFDLSNDMHVSHICHQRRCINPAHLSYEPNNVNQDRHVCRSIVPAQCKTHQPFPDCLLWKGTHTHTHIQT
jgi:hypothetical protein